jgi:glycosyltransferase involved in cell wall biosynthesis
MNKISVALCTYNGAKFLNAQLESYLAQTRQPDELIVCDDCSTDETASIIETFARLAPFCVTLHVNEKNLGSTKNFEEAILLCSGDLIFLSDQDDVWLPGKIAKIEAEFIKNPTAGLIFTNAELVDEDLKPLGAFLWDFTFSEKERKKARKGNFLEVLMMHNVVTGATAAFRTEFRHEVLPIPADIPNLIHDGWIALAFAALGKMEFIDEPLIKYRQHAGQQLGLNLSERKKQQEDEQQQQQQQQKKKKKERAANFAHRQKGFESSIHFLHNEIERLEQTKVILGGYRIFKDRQHLIKNLAFEYLEEKKQLIEHYEARKSLPPEHRKRLLPIVKEISSGRYHCFSKGFLSAAKDLFER